MLNALVSLNFFDADYSVGSGGQANPFIDPAREVGEAKARLPDTRLVCGGLDGTRPNGTARSDAGVAR